MSAGDVPAYVGLGSNLGDRAANLARALDLLAATPGVRIVAVSDLHETPPWGYTQQPAFLNAAARLATTLGPRQLLLALKAVERRVGREETFRWGPRVVDLDLLLYSDLRLARRGLEVPHPRLIERAFVLVPLRDVYPEYRGPDGTPIDALIARLDTSGIRRLPATRLWRAAGRVGGPRITG